MEALQEWIEMEGFITTLWFLNKWGRIHLLSFSLHEEQALSLSLKLLQNIIWDYKMIPKWNGQVGFYRFSNLHQLASRVPSFAMASLGFFTIGFVTRHLWGVLAALTHLASNIVRHGELLTSLLAFSSPLQVGGVWSLVLSGIAHLSLAFLLAIASSFAFHSPLRVGGEWSLMLTALSRLWSPFTRHGELAFVLFLCFSSLFSVLSSIPAQLGKVR